MRHRPFGYAVSRPAGWFRVFGFGISWTKYDPLFSEHYGHRSPFARLGQYRLFFLRPGKW